MKNLTNSIPSIFDSYSFLRWKLILKPPYRKKNGKVKVQDNGHVETEVSRR
jgi:hypothetical protein